MDNVVDDHNIPTLYLEFINIFLQSRSDLLASYYEFDQAIELKDGNKLG
jgi:hypothetical protein